MSARQELEQRLVEVRAEARRGATDATFRRYEALWRAARERGERELAASVLRDLAKLTAELDPVVARELARAAASASGGAAPTPSAAAGSSAVDVSVVVLGLPAAATAAPALESLRRQTLAASRFETLLADRADGAAVNEALAAARGRVLVFVAPDVALAPDALERHLAAQAEGTPPRFVLGALELEGLSLRPLAWSLERLGLLGCQHAPEDGGAVPADCLGFDHASVRTEVLRGVRGCDRSLSAFAAIEAGARLLAAGVDCVLAPEIRASRSPAIDLDGWLARARAMGREWLALRRQHGAGAPPAWLSSVGLEEAATEALLERLLAGTDAHARRVRSLRESLHEIETLLARDPARADAALAKVGDDLASVLLDVTRHELTRGFVHAAIGGAGDRLEQCATRTLRGAAVLVAGAAAAVPAVSAALAQLPPWAEVVVAVPTAALAQALPIDRRVVPFPLPPAGTSGAMRRALLAATGADFFVLLDGTCVPTRADWEALRLTLATLPAIGACGVDGEEGALARARLCASLPPALVAARRDVIEQEGDDAVPFLDRLVRRGLRLATATAAAGREPAACGA